MFLFSEMQMKPWSGLQKGKSVIGGTADWGRIKNRARRGLRMRRKEVGFQFLRQSLAKANAFSAFSYHVQSAKFKPRKSDLNGWGARRALKRRTQYVVFVACQRRTKTKRVLAVTTSLQPTGLHLSASNLLAWIRSFDYGFCRYSRLESKFKPP